MKRSNELGQIEKSAYDAIEDADEDESVGTWKRLSSDKMQKRRTVRVASKWNTEKEKVTKNENVFASVSFASTTKQQLPKEDTKKKPMFSFMPNANKSSSSTTTTGTMTELHLPFFQQIKLLIQENPFVNLTNVCNEFMTNTEKYRPSSSSSSSGAITGTTTINNKSEATKTSLTFGFTSSTTTSSSKTDSESGQTKFKFSGFGSSSTSNNDNNNIEKDNEDKEPSTMKPKPFTSFNFSSSPSNTKATQKKEIQEDESSNAKDDPAEIIPETNDKEDVTYETRAKYLKMGPDKKWKSYCTGNLRLYKNKTSNTSRLVLRNEIGKVQLNIGIYKGMQFTKNLKPKKNLGFVGFVAIADEKVGMEKFNLLVKLEEVDKLLNSLEKLTA